MPDIKAKKLSIEVTYNEPKHTLNPINTIGDFYSVKGITRNDDIAIGQRTLTANVGDNIQKIINSIKDTGGTVHLLNGTHTLNSNIVLYSGVYLAGESADSTVFDFVNNTSGIVIAGSSAYSTGTVAITNNGTSITGTGTTFTSSMVGQNILLSGIWYPIAAFVSTTNIYIGLPYAGATLSGASYTIATMIDDVKINDLTIKNASVGIYCQYSNELFFKDVNVQSSGVGIQYQTTSNSSINECDIVACNVGYKLNDTHFTASIQSSAIDSQVGENVLFDNVTGTSFVSFFCLNGATNGITVKNGSNIQLSGVFNENGANGIELSSNNSAIALQNVSCINNGGDGLKLTATSDKNIISGSLLESNGGYGVNIAAATCDDNLVSSNIFKTNTTANMTDSGTGTLIRSNIGVLDN